MVNGATNGGQFFGVAYDFCQFESRMAAAKDTSIPAIEFDERSGRRHTQSLDGCVHFGRGGSKMARRCFKKFLHFGVHSLKSKEFFIHFQHCSDSGSLESLAAMRSTCSELAMEIRRLTQLHQLRGWRNGANGPGPLVNAVWKRASRIPSACALARWIVCARGPVVPAAPLRGFASPLAKFLGSFQEPMRRAV